MICLECELMSQPNLFIFNRRYLYIYEQHSGSSGRRVGNYESTLYKSDYVPIYIALSHNLDLLAIIIILPALCSYVCVYSSTISNILNSLNYILYIEGSTCITNILFA